MLERSERKKPKKRLRKHSINSLPVLIKQILDFDTRLFKRAQVLKPKQERVSQFIMKEALTMVKYLILLTVAKIRLLLR
jgi:hypothetical protein